MVKWYQYLPTSLNSDEIQFVTEVSRTISGPNTQDDEAEFKGWRVKGKMNPLSWKRGWIVGLMLNMYSVRDLDKFDS